jgi:hypothetical protein
MIIIEQEGILYLNVFGFGKVGPSLLSVAIFFVISSLEFGMFAIWTF